MAISWDDLKFKVSDEDAARWLTLWADWIDGPVQPLFLSKFGDWFLRQPDGTTAKLSVIEGQYSIIARTPAELVVIINSPDWAQLHLRSELVLKLHQREIKAGPGECYGFVPHPFLNGGEINLDNAMVMPMGSWQSICAQTVPVSKSGPDTV